MSAKPTIREQFTGAAIGTAVALGVYGTYSVGAPIVRGLFASVSVSVSAEEAGGTFTDASRETRREEIAAHARAIIARMTRP